MRLKRFYLLLILPAIFACSPIMPFCPPAATGDRVYVVGEGWHAEIAIPVEVLGRHLAFYRKVFPGAKVIMFGYGKKTFFIAPPKTISEYILGPVPGPAAIHAMGIRTTPMEAYSEQSTVTLMLPPGGAEALSDYIWNDLAKDQSGNPQIVARSSDPDGLFYAAVSQYNLLHTCNSWTEDALHYAGLPVATDAVVFSGQVMRNSHRIAKSQCPF